MNRTQGVMQNFIEERFGFAQGDDGIRYFVHGREFEKAGINVPPPVGTRLAFNGQDRPQGWRAVDVEIVE